jgi:hypothetical protein
MKRFLFIANLAIAIIVGVLVDVLFPTSFTNAEQYFLGLLIFVALSLAEVQHSIEQSSDQVAKIALHERRELAIWEARSELDQQLQEVRRLFHVLDEARETTTDLFYQYHVHKLSELEKSLRDATTKFELTIDESMFTVTAWLMSSAFRGQGDDILRAVLPTASLEFFFDVHTRTFFQRTYNHVLGHKCAGVRRLVVLDRPEDLTDERLQRLAAFHQGTDGYECQVVTRAVYDRIVSDYKLNRLIVDFGIYGNSYLYKALKNANTEIVGNYSRDAEEIKSFTECFESCWESGTPIDLSSQLEIPSPATVGWVFNG